MKSFTLPLHVGDSRRETIASIRIIFQHKYTQTVDTSAIGQSAVVLQQLFAIDHHFPWFTLPKERLLQQHLVLNADIVQRNTTLATMKTCHRKANIVSITVSRTQPTFNTSQTIFEIALLEDITNISISAATFEYRAQVYNENFCKIDQDRLQQLTAFGRNITDDEHPWRLTEETVEDAWFLYSLVLFYEQGPTESYKFCYRPRNISKM